jgi:hypothetical protein
MVDVRVAEHQRVNGLRVEREVQVPLVGFSPMALVHTAFKQNAFPVDFDQVHGAGDFLGGPVKGDTHGSSSCYLKLFGKVS